MDMNNIPPTMETMQPKGNDLQGLSALNNARVCRYAVMPAQAIDLDWYQADWCCDLPEACEIAETHNRVTGEPATIWRTPSGEPWAMSTIKAGEWISPRALTYRGVRYWGHLD